MSAFGNRSISASAGTGKTWALAHRYLALLVADVEPDRICALTFSRKAAGEIFDSIVERLCLSVTNEGERAKSALSIAEQGLGVIAPALPTAYLALLRKLLNQNHRLRVGTLDSFILGIARSFPLELGLPPDVQPMNNDGGEAQALRQALLTRLYDPQQRQRDDTGDVTGKALLAAFRQATFGAESKGLVQKLEGAIASHYEFYRQNREKAWGVANRIWPDARWWEEGTAAELARARDADYLEALKSAFGTTGRPKALGEAYASIAEAAAKHTADCPFPKPPSPTIFKQLLAGGTNAVTAPQTDYYSKPYTLPADLWSPLRAALGNLVGVDVQRSLQKTAGMHDLLQRYDTLYREAQRRDGRLSFSDFARRLGDPMSLPSLTPGSPDRLYIDYRIDGQLDHWLLDEFQDTSDIQWNAISNLIDEVVQDAENRRSFFYVGDIKQSIYGWRGGNHRLFGHVRKQLQVERGQPLVRCHRSLPAIINVVNTVFTDLPGWMGTKENDTGPHVDAGEAFMAEWQPHVSARSGEGQGFAALLQYEPKKKRSSGAGTGTDDDASAEEDDTAGDAAQYEAIAAILTDVQPIRNNLSAVVLVRSNPQGRACADVLRRKLTGTPVVHEGTGGIVDNPVVTLLLALVRYAAHPADEQAARHLQMSPFAEMADPLGKRENEAPLEGGGIACDYDWLRELPYHFLTLVHELGFAGALRLWGKRLMIAPTMDAGDLFSQQRLTELLAAAESFDATGSRDPDAFGDHIRAHQIKSEAAAGVIRVMTIHQAKGLGFDMVLVPFDPLAQSFGSTKGIDFLCSDDEGGSAQADGWVLQSPQLDVLEAAGGEPSAALEAARAKENFAQLCVLYVALTRAKQALYMLVPTPAKNSKAVRDADLLRERLCGDQTAREDVLHGLSVLYDEGDPEWFSAASGAPGKRGSELRQLPSLTVKLAEETTHKEPSKERDERRPYPASYVFDSEASAVRDFGSAIHRLFEGIEWIEDADLEHLITAWHAESRETPQLLRDVEKQFRMCVASPEIRTLLARPANSVQTEIWRETPFHYVRTYEDSREIITGRFDRVVVERDGESRPIRATVMDFKSNRVKDVREMNETAAGYAPQMQDYAAAVSRLLGLPIEAVSSVLLFTRLAKVQKV